MYVCIYIYNTFLVADLPEHGAPPDDVAQACVGPHELAEDSGALLKSSSDKYHLYYRYRLTNACVMNNTCLCTVSLSLSLYMYIYIYM